MQTTTNKPFSGILLVNKHSGNTSFSLVSLLRKITKVKKIGHAGTLDPFASGLMILLIGQTYTKKSSDFLNLDKDYDATIFLGKTTETYDREGVFLNESSYKPSLDEVLETIAIFSGEIEQIPPMFSAKKVQGKKLYKLARKGQTIERKPQKVQVVFNNIDYQYPYLKVTISCSKGTYIRSLAHDIGEKLGSGAYLHNLIRNRIGPFHLKESIDQDKLEEDLIKKYLITN